MIAKICGFKFSSKFDSGNLKEVILVSCKPSSQYYEFDLFLHEDNEKQRENEFIREEKVKRKHNWNAWFYFFVVPDKVGDKVSIRIKNMDNQEQFFNQEKVGMTPVIRVGKNQVKYDHEELNLKCRVFKSPEDRKVKKMDLIFEYVFKEKKKTYFSFSYPYSYKRLQKRLKHLDDIKRKSHYFLKNNIHYKRDLLATSLEKHRIDLITISSSKDFHEEEEEEEGEEEEKDEEESETRKKVILITARVHPGESPSSFVLASFIDFILDEKDPRAILLRNNFVFKIIPMLNPDGVCNGNWRSNSLSLDLNRQFDKEGDRLELYFPQIHSLLLLLERLKMKKKSMKKKKRKSMKKKKKKSMKKYLHLSNQQ